MNALSGKCHQFAKLASHYARPPYKPHSTCLRFHCHLSGLQELSPSSAQNYLATGRDPSPSLASLMTLCCAVDAIPAHADADVHGKPNVCILTASWKV